MEPKFQSSFIPKKPVVSGAQPAFVRPTASVTTRVNIFNLIAEVVFGLTILVLGGLFAYKQILTSQISQADKDLTAARAAIQPEAIQSLINASNRISSAKKLLNNHVVISELFALLQSLTVQKMRFNNFSYTYKDSGMMVTMDGEAQNYNALAEQARLFGQNDFIKNPVFTDFDLADNGHVTAKFTAMIDPTLVSYRNAVAALGISQDIPVQMQLGTSTASTTHQ